MYVKKYTAFSIFKQTYVPLQSWETQTIQSFDQIPLPPLWRLKSPIQKPIEFPDKTLLTFILKAAYLCYVKFCIHIPIQKGRFHIELEGILVVLYSDLEEYLEGFVSCNRHVRVKEMDHVFLVVPNATQCALYHLTLPNLVIFLIKRHIPPMMHFPGGGRTSSPVPWLIKDSNSAFMACSKWGLSWLLASALLMDMALARFS